MRHNIFNSKVPPQHTQKNGIFYGIHVIFCDHTITRFQQIHAKLLYSSPNASTFQTERKYILPETQVRLDTNVKAFTSKRTCVFRSRPDKSYNINNQEITDQFTFFLRSSFNCCQTI